MLKTLFIGLQECRYFFENLYWPITPPGEIGTWNFCHLAVLRPFSYVVTASNGLMESSLPERTLPFASIAVHNELLTGQSLSLLKLEKVRTKFNRR